jgi:DNA-binding HxlR family transcriptional regulator
MHADLRSGCPINLTLELLGDCWSLLVIRDIMFGDRRHYREVAPELGRRDLIQHPRRRLKTLLDCGIVTKTDDPTHEQKAIYTMTEQGIELLPILAQIGSWGGKYLPVTRELGIRAQLLADGGPRMWEAFMDELRERHLSKPRKKRSGSSVTAQLQAAYEAAVAQRATASNHE